MTPEDAEYIARATGRRVREELTGWDALWTLAFRGTIAFGIVLGGAWCAWWVLAKIVWAINHPLER